MRRHSPDTHSSHHGTPQSRTRANNAPRDPANTVDPNTDQRDTSADRKLSPEEVDREVDQTLAWRSGFDGPPVYGSLKKKGGNK